MIWCAALLMMTSCGSNTTGSGDSADSRKEPDAGENGRTHEKNFIAITDTMLAGRWVAVSGTDSIIVTLGIEGSTYSKGLPQPYMSWRQMRANVILLTRQGEYCGSVTDTADIDVDARPMTLSTRGRHPLNLRQE